jgi:hypothetical protein
MGFRQFAILGLSIALTLPPAVALVFNYQRQNSPLLASLMLSLRTSPTVQKELGSEIRLLNGKYTWIHGELNSIQGKVEAGFWAKGNNPEHKAWVELTCRRDRDGIWHTTKYQLTVYKDKDIVKKVDLLQEAGGVSWEQHKIV